MDTARQNIPRTRRPSGPRSSCTAVSAIPGVGPEPGQLGVQRPGPGHGVEVGVGRGEERFVVGESAQDPTDGPREAAQVLAGHDVEEQVHRLVVEQVEIVVARTAALHQRPDGEQIHSPPSRWGVPHTVASGEFGQVDDRGDVGRALRPGRCRGQRHGGRGQVESVESGRGVELVGVQGLPGRIENSQAVPRRSLVRDGPHPDSPGGVGGVDDRRLGDPVQRGHDAVPAELDLQHVVHGGIEPGHRLPQAHEGERAVVLPPDVHRAVGAQVNQDAVRGRRGCAPSDRRYPAAPGPSPPRRSPASPRRHGAP